MYSLDSGLQRRNVWRYECYTACKKHGTDWKSRDASRLYGAQKCNVKRGSLQLIHLLLDDPLWVVHG